MTSTLVHRRLVDFSWLLILAPSRSIGQTKALSPGPSSAEWYGMPNFRQISSDSETCSCSASLFSAAWRPRGTTERWLKRGEGQCDPTGGVRLHHHRLGAAAKVHGRTWRRSPRHPYWGCGHAHDCAAGGSAGTRASARSRARLCGDARPGPPDAQPCAGTPGRPGHLARAREASGRQRRTSAEHRPRQAGRGRRPSKSSRPCSVSVTMRSL